MGEWVAIAFRRKRVFRLLIKDRGLFSSVIICRNCLTAGTGLTTRAQEVNMFKGIIPSQLPYGGNQVLRRKRLVACRKGLFTSRNCLTAGTGLTTSKRVVGNIHENPELSQLPYGGNRSYDVYTLLFNNTETKSRNCLTAGTSLTTKTEIKVKIDNCPFIPQLPYGGNKSYDISKKLFKKGF